MSLLSPVQQAQFYALKKTGLKWENRDNWSDADRTAYLAANAQFRRENASLFTLEEQRAAANYQSAADAKAPDFSYVEATADALGERLTEVGGQVAGVGEGIFSSLSLMRWLLPVATVAAGVILLIALFRRSGAAAR